MLGPGEAPRTLVRALVEGRCQLVLRPDAQNARAKSSDVALRALDGSEDLLPHVSFQRKIVRWVGCNYTGLTDPEDASSWSAAPRRVLDTTDSADPASKHNPSSMRICVDDA